VKAHAEAASKKSVKSCKNIFMVDKESIRPDDRLKKSCKYDGSNFEDRKSRTQN
jgi:hypothetical protein